jgi:hypothetical protein
MGVDITQHTVTLVSWNTKTMAATYTIDNDPTVHAVIIPIRCTTEALAVAAIKNDAINVLTMAQAPNLTSLVGTAL